MQTRQSSLFREYSTFGLISEQQAGLTMSVRTKYSKYKCLAGQFQ